ncbi:MAG: hypothetical protein ACD_27C00013G0011 [uncultured bacterium]|nr:MAG: hypothetical protein ACD_27C00013G0011 [uncultured bacterium]
MSGTFTIIGGTSIEARNPQASNIFKQYLSPQSPSLPELPEAIGFNPESDVLTLDFPSEKTASAALAILNNLAPPV